MHRLKSNSFDSHNYIPAYSNFTIGSLFGVMLCRKDTEFPEINNADYMTMSVLPIYVVEDPRLKGLPPVYPENY